jgi:hypothetical protein
MIRNFADCILVSINAVVGFWCAFGKFESVSSLVLSFGLQEWMSSRVLRVDCGSTEGGGRAFLATRIFAAAATHVLPK